MSNLFLAEIRRETCNTNNIVFIIAYQSDNVRKQLVGVLGCQNIGVSEHRGVGI